MTATTIGGDSRASGVPGESDGAGGAENVTFDSYNPANDDIVGTWPIRSQADVRAAVDHARSEASWWGSLTFAERKEILLTWRSVITRRMAQLSELVHRETGKPVPDAQLEIVLAIDHIAWAARHAKKVLAPRRVAPGLLMANQAAQVEYRPFGVIGVIGPWNYPVFTPLGSITYALAAGNTVVFKPSEFTPGVGVWLADTLAEVTGRQILQTVTGLGETGSALSAAGVDKLAFTGSAATGKKVMASCASTLTPVVIEAGGKDAMIVDDDADLAAAAEAAVWAGMSNAGQTCIGIERVYVHERVFDDFVDALTRHARHLRAGSDADASYGPMTMPTQADVVRQHVREAVERGARVILGDPDAIGERTIQPMILSHVPDDALEMCVETFGPTLAVNPVRDMDEAVSRTNATDYGLAGAVFAKKRGVQIARQIRSGMTSVNSVVAFAGVPSLPFGGVGQSGFGRIHGADGLREFCFAKSLTRQRFAPPLAVTSFPRNPRDDSRLAGLITLLHGNKHTLK